MTPQELKNSILQLAIQGKLVEQRQEEGTAEELYRQIQQEKQKLIREGKIKKEKPLPEITEEEKPFDIPESWKWIRFGEVSQLLDGEKMSGVSLPYLEAKYLRGKADATILESGKFVRKGTNIVLVDGENSGEVFSTKEAGYLGSTFKVLYMATAINQDYILYYLAFHKNDYRNNKKGAAIPHLNKELFFQSLFPVPPLDEQKRIVAKIEELLPLIEQYEKAWSQLEEFNKRFPDDMQKSILQMAIQGKLVEQKPEEGTGEELYQQIQAEKQKLIKEGKIKKEKPLPEITEKEKPFDIPESWKWVRLNSIYNFIDYRGKTPSKMQHGIRLIGSANIRNGYLDFSKEDAYISEEEYLTRKSRGLTKNGDILFITEGGSMGYAAINTWSGECSCGQRVITLQAYSQDLIVNLLYLRYIQSTYFQKEIRERKTGSAAQGIKGDTMKKVLIPLPPLAEQERIVKQIEVILPFCQKLSNANK